jgi:hypothetical protein
MNAINIIYEYIMLFLGTTWNFFKHYMYCVRYSNHLLILNPEIYHVIFADIGKKYK